MVDTKPWLDLDEYTAALTKFLSIHAGEVAEREIEVPGRKEIAKMGLCILCKLPFMNLKVHVLDIHKQTIAVNAIMPGSEELTDWLERVLAHEIESELVDE